jgi:hypothetical protein
VSAFGLSHDDYRILERLRVGECSTIRLASAVDRDERNLTKRLLELADERLVMMSGAAGSTPIWALTDAGRSRVR